MPWRLPAPRSGKANLPAAHLDEDALELKLLLDHREDLVKARVEDQQRLRWHLHDLWPEFEIPARALDRIVWLDRIARRLQRAEQTARVQYSRGAQAGDPRAHPPHPSAGEARALRAGRRPGARATGSTRLRRPDRRQARRETAGVERFASDAKLARLAGVARSRRLAIAERHRLDRGGAASSTAPCTESRSPRAAFIRPLASSWTIAW